MRIDRPLLCLFGFVATLTLLQAPGQAQDPSKAMETKEPCAAMILSTGDNMFYYKWFPIDSPAGVGASFDIFKSHFNIDRIIWRGAQAQWMTHSTGLRREAEEMADLYIMEFDAETKDKLSHKAGEEARKRGIAYWGYMPLFEVGAGEEAVAMAGLGPYSFEEDIRREHPEYCLYDRAGVGKGSTVEWGYPEVRKYFLNRYEKLFQNGGDFSIYDGIIFYTYVENFYPRYTDQYMFSGIAAEDFKKRYGVDVFTEDFDRAKYQEMRGEYITQYLREMRQLFNTYNKKLAIYIDGIEPDIPMRWPCYPGILVPGSVKMDWRTWIQEGLVDEIALRSTTEMEHIQPFLDAAKGTNVRISLLTNQMPPKLRHLHAQGVTRHVWSPELPSEFPPQNSPVEAMDGDDLIAKMSVLRQIRDGDLDVPIEKLTALFKHPDLIVRRQAVAAVLGRRMPEAIPALEEAAMDPENSFRCVVIDALGTLHGPNTVAVIGKSLEKYPLFQTRLVARTAWAMMAGERLDDLVKLYQETKSSYVRMSLLELIIAKRAVPPIDAPPAFRPLVENGAIAESLELRTIAAFAAGYYHDPEIARLLMRMLDDQAPVVQAAAAFSLGEVARRIEDVDSRQAIFDRLAKQWHAYSKDLDRSDKNWGYRVVAEALMYGFGPKGEQHVVGVLNGSDKHLAKQAWDVLFHPNDGWNFYELSLDEGEQRYAHYPVSTRLQIERKTYSVPKTVHLFQQDFGAASPDPTGQLGDIWSLGGRWTGLDELTIAGNESGRHFLSVGVGKNGKGARLVGSRAWDLSDGRFKNRLRGHFPSSPTAYGLANGMVDLSLDVRNSEGAKAQIALAADARSTPTVAVEFSPDGEVVLQGTVHATMKNRVPHAAWCKLQLRLNYETATAALHLDSSESIEVPFDANPHLRAILLNASGSPGAAADFSSLRVSQTVE